MTDPRARARAAAAERILRAAIAAADPAPAVSTAVTADARVLNAAHVHVLAMGKAAAAMARAARAAIPRTVDSTLIIVPHGTVVEHSADVEVIHAAHPLPDASSVAAAGAAERLLADARAGDIVVVLISGGASALCAQPAAGITIEQYAALVRDLMHAGADIVELNTVRRHIDVLKGGGMARLAAPADVLGLIISDVVGNPLHLIASGPLSPAGTTPSDAQRVLERYDPAVTCPDSIRNALTPDVAMHDAVASADSRVTQHIIADNATAVAGAARAASDLGWDVRVSDAAVTGSARTAGTRIARAALEAARRLRHGARPVCLLYGGETTVTVRGAGSGGRNQELVLSAALTLQDTSGITIASIGTDGVDGPTDAAGAVADGGTVAAAARAGVDAALALEHNDSHRFFTAARSLLRTGATGTNVMDVQVALIDAPVES